MENKNENENESEMNDVDSLSNNGVEKLKTLVDQLGKQWKKIKTQDSLVEAAIDNVLDKEQQTILRKAKKKVLEEETKLIKSLQVLELAEFFRTAVLLERKYNELYTLKNSEQEEARITHALKIEDYEMTSKPLSEGTNLVSLIFGTQQLYLSAFEQFMNKVLSECKTRKVKITNQPKVSCKNIERAFYETYYVYSGDHRQMTDLLRCSLVFDNFVDLYRTFSILQTVASNYSSIKGGILRVQDQFHSRRKIPFGYRNLTVNLYAPDSRLVCEIQLHHEIFHQYQEDFQAIHKCARLFECNDRNIAYEYIVEYVQSKIATNERYIPGMYAKTKIFGQEEEEKEGQIIDSNNNEKDHDEKNKSEKIITSGRDGECDACPDIFEKLIAQWLPDKKNKSPDGVIQIDVNGSLKSYLQILQEDGFDSIESLKQLKEQDLEKMKFKTGHLRRFLKAQEEYFLDLEKKKKEEKEQKEKLEIDQLRREHEGLIKEQEELVKEQRLILQRQEDLLKRQEFIKQNELSKIVKQPSTSRFPFGNTSVYIRTCHRTYLRAHPGGEGATLDLQVQPNGWEKYFVAPLTDNKFALRTSHGTYIRAHPGGEGSRLDLQVKIGPWEQFTMVSLGNSQWAIQTCHGTYFRAHPGGEGSRIDLQTFVGPWEHFVFQQAS